MSARGPIDCAQFDLLADELALGQVDEPTRGRLLAHAATCPHCHSLLESLGTVADRLLLVAPQVEPPEGFESRVVARLGASVSSPVRRSARVRWIAAAVAGLLVAGATVALFTRPDSSPSPVATAAIVTDEGAEIGAAQLLADPTSYLLITVENPRPGPGLRHCELLGSDGTWELVGQWDAAGIASGVWAVGVDPELLDATAMRITSDGTVVATATFE
jgi:hypothetical protein